MADLQIDAYNEAEARARLTTPYPAIRAFTPTHFHLNGFPTRVVDEAELLRYCDIMGENTPRNDWLDTKRYTQAEAEAILAMRGQVEDLTFRKFGRKVTPFMCLFGPIPMLRMVEHLSQRVERKLRIMDIGAGSGYTSAYLADAGHKVIATDVTQALYLWQNRLFDKYTFSEWIVEGLGLSPLGQIEHVPWWMFAELYKNSPIYCDLVICDAALGELDPWAFRYVMHLARDCLQESELGYFLYQSVGEQRAQSHAFIGHYFKSLGYTLGGGVEVYVQSAPRFSKLPKKDGLEFLYRLRQPKDATIKIEDFFHYNSSDLLESYAFCDYINVGR